MVIETEQNQFVMSDLGLGPNDYRQLAEILIDAIPSDRKLEWSGKVMAYLASETMHSAEHGGLAPRVSTKAIHTDLGGNPNQEPSQWLSGIWRKIEQRHFPEIESRLIELCRKSGLKVYPVLEKDGGSPAFYRLGTRELPPSENSSPEIDDEVSPNLICYEPALTLKLSRLGKLIFGQGLRWTAVKRYSYLFWQLFFLIAVAAFELMLWAILWFSVGPLTGQELVVTAMAIVVPVAAYWHFHEVFRLWEDRLMIAPDWSLAWKEFGATIEINRAKNSDQPSTILVRRYTATCPICGWMVKLDRGEPDFPHRIVGRCEENPREHVFSFDRSSRRGKLFESAAQPVRSNPD